MSNKSLFSAILSMLLIITSCTKNPQPVQQSIEGNYIVSGLFVGKGTFTDTAQVVAVSPTRYETTFPTAIDTIFKTWKFTFEIDSSTNTLINWQAEGNTYPVPQSNFMTVVNPTDDPNYPGAPWIDPPYSNVYDPQTQTFWMHYGYAIGAANQTQYSREIFEKFVKVNN